MPAQVADSVQKILSDLFSGATSFPAVGLFTRESGQKQTESIQVLESFCETAAWVANKGFLWALAQVVGALLEQESIACLVDGRMFLIPRLEEIAMAGALEIDPRRLTSPARQLGS
ncbi:hypothetical protein [Luteolibacter sp. Populi]|uniref:hypothetical protein n=1 Tax=Luteolibacter sp. Populi TaxID=3230487 RepID=UPI0034674C14